jgi:hypothetical protein
VTKRYDLCEDLVSLLTLTSRDMLLSLGITKDHGFEQIHRGLTADGEVETAPEAQCVLRRVAEMLELEPLAVSP